MNNTNPQVILNDSQKRLVADLVQTYGIEPDEIKFFAGDPKPFLSYEATCVMADRLLDLVAIDIEPVESSFVDSVTLKCTITRHNGTVRSSVGVANVKETADGQPLSTQQIFSLASARAIRNTLRTAGIDLIRTHEARGSAPADFTGPARDARSALVAQVHILGKDAGLIEADNGRAAWQSLLFARYGVRSSANLDDVQLADLAAMLRSLAPKAAA